jgi:integrase
MYLVVNGKPAAPGSNLPDASAGELVRAYASQAKAANTVRAYAADWRHFTAWCRAHAAAPLPASAETVALYAADLAAAAKPSTIARRMSAISQAHQLAGYASPTADARVRTVLAGIRRAKGTAPRVKKPVLLEDLRAMLEGLPANAIGIRDRALLLAGFAGAFRRSELVALDWEDVEFRGDGLAVMVRRSKTDPEGQGRLIGIPRGRQAATCPVRALEAWREASGEASGPVFRPIDRHGNVRNQRLSGRAVARIVKRSLPAGRYDAADYAGHSLRAGLATAAAMGGASERAIMNQTGHRSLAMVRRYIREGSLFRENAAAVTGL